MKNFIRIFLVSFVLIGGMALFAYWSAYRFNHSLDTLRDTCYAIANQPPVLYCDKANEEQIPTTVPEEPIVEPTPTSTPEPGQEAEDPKQEPAPTPTPEPAPQPDTSPTETSL